ncbi:MAG: hypothetical protein MUF43_12745 [Flavobacterium sp.]|jgi:hypothetical protein|nr:hypothetical protein [Flavobacterium sp.]
MRLTIFLILFTVKSFSQENGLYEVFDKPFISCDSFINVLSRKPKDEDLFNFLHQKLLRQYVFHPKDFRKVKSLIEGLEVKKFEVLENQVRAQYDWKKNRKNKKMEKLFIEIDVNDQLYRVPEANCNFATRNFDSCKKLYNFDEKVRYNDSVNKVIVDSIWKQYGYPKKNWLGKGQYGFNIFLHHDFSFVNEKIEILRAAYNKEFISGTFLVIEDKNLLWNCKEQKNGKVFCGQIKLCNPCEYNKKCCEDKSSAK